jgi:hypothetical protein
VVRTAEAAVVTAVAVAAVEMAAEAVINPANSWENSGFLICRNMSF